MDGLLKDATRPGRPRTAREAATMQEVVRVTLNETPQGATHWSTRTLAKHLKTNVTAVARIWREHGLKPHRVKTFKLSSDPRFIEKLQDFVFESNGDAVNKLTNLPSLPISAATCGIQTTRFSGLPSLSMLSILGRLESVASLTARPLSAHSDSIGPPCSNIDSSARQLDLRVAADSPRIRIRHL